MSETYRAASRRDWQRAGSDENLSTEDLSLGCLQRIADATELMAKNYQGLINERNEARKSRDYWMDRHAASERSNRALRGQITRLQAKLEKANAAQQ